MQANISTNYMGIPLSSPIIAGSSGITNSLDNLKKLEDAGVGAVVLKSLFEEEIKYERNKIVKDAANFGNDYQYSYDYIARYAQEERLTQYLNLIEQAKSSLSIPIIASINCISFSEWLSFVKRIEDAGADAVELNVFELPSSVNTSYEDIERLFFEIIQALKKNIEIPISIKTSYYFTDMAKFMQRLSWSGIKALVIFNRFFNIDIDIQNLVFKPAHILSSPNELSHTLRWTAILSDLIKCDLSACTGVKSGEDAIKLLLAGAKTVQLASCIYENGIESIKVINQEIIDWMQHKSIQTIDEFRGKMALRQDEVKSAALLRTQFMKHYSGIE